MSYHLHTKRGDVFIREDSDESIINRRIPGVELISKSERLEDILDRYSEVSGISKEELLKYDSPNSEITLAESLLRLYGEMNGMYEMEGAVIASDGKCVILEGDSLAGKSRATYELSQFYDIGADDSIIITMEDGKLKFIGGNRFSHGKRWHSKNEWVDFGQTALSDLEVYAVIKFKLVYYPEEGKFIIDRLTENNLQFLMWQWISSKARDTDGYLGNMEYPLPSLDNQELAKERLDFCREAKKTPFYFYEGGIDILAKLISIIFEGKNPIEYKDSISLQPIPVANH